MKPRDFCLAVIVCAVWGLNFSVIKAGVENLDPFILIGLRLSFAALPAVFFIAKPKVPLRYLVMYGVTFGVGLWGVMALSMHWGLSPGMASIILECSAFMSVILGVVLLREQLDKSQKVGLLLAFIGVAFIFSIEDGSVSLVGALLAFFAALCLSLVGLMVKKWQIKEMLAFVIWSSLFAPIPLFFLAYLTAGPDVFRSFFSAINGTVIGSVLFQAYPTTIIGYWIWNKLIVRYPLSLMGPMSLLIPLFGLLGSVIFYSEDLSPAKVLATSFILAGVIAPLIYGQVKFLGKSRENI